MEDDWVPFPNTLNFDKLLLEEYEKVNFEGFLSAWEDVFKPAGSIRHSIISVGIISKDSFKNAHNNITDNGFMFDRSNITQLEFSSFFTNNDYSDSGKKYMIPFWQTMGGVIFEYATHLSPNYLLVPIQLLQLNKYKYVMGNYTVHNNGKPNFDIDLLTLNIHKAGKEYNEVTLKQNRVNKEENTRKARQAQRVRKEERKRNEETQRKKEWQREVERQIIEERQRDTNKIYKLNVYKISSSKKRMEFGMEKINNKKNNQQGNPNIMFKLK